VVGEAVRQGGSPGGARLLKRKNEEKIKRVRRMKNTRKKYNETKNDEKPI
jgi:hypothetical protein